MVTDAWSTNTITVIVGEMGQAKKSILTNLIKTVFNKCFKITYPVMPEIHERVKRILYLQNIYHQNNYMIR